MEQLQKLRVWLETFPEWGEAALAVDTTGTVPGDCGLYPLGVEVLRTREDVLGNVRCRLRQTYLLRRAAPRGEAAAAWLLAFSRWAAENAHTAPVFGSRQQLRAEKGRLLSTRHTGVDTYEVRLTFEYDSEE